MAGQRRLTAPTQIMRSRCIMRAATTHCARNNTASILAQRTRSRRLDAMAIENISNIN
jgi:hypothetical protein